MHIPLYIELQRIARAKELAFYSDLAPMLNLSMDVEEDRAEIAKLLGEILIHEHNAGRPLLPAIVVHKNDDSIPGEGFFSIATDLGLYSGSRNEMKRLIFWSNRVTEVHNYWPDA